LTSGRGTSCCRSWTARSGGSTSQVGVIEGGGTSGVCRGGGMQAAGALGALPMWVGGGGGVGALSGLRPPFPPPARRRSPPAAAHAPQAPSGGRPNPKAALTLNLTLTAAAGPVWRPPPPAAVLRGLPLLERAPPWLVDLLLRGGELRGERGRAGAGAGPGVVPQRAALGAHAESAAQMGGRSATVIDWPSSTRRTRTPSFGYAYHPPLPCLPAALRRVRRRRGGVAV
jgi:hypothetical protein